MVVVNAFKKRKTHTNQYMTTSTTTHTYTTTCAPPPLPTRSTQSTQSTQNPPSLRSFDAVHDQGCPGLMQGEATAWVWKSGGRGVWPLFSFGVGVAQGGHFGAGGGVGF